MITIVILRTFVVVMIVIIITKIIIIMKMRVNTNHEAKIMLKQMLKNHSKFQL